MAENRKQLLHVRSSVEGKLPTAGQIEHGEIAINFFDGNEKLSIKSSTGNIRTFSTDEQNNAKFATKIELGNKVDNTDIADMLTKTEASSTYQPKGEYLTRVPSEYVTETELNGKGYATTAQVNLKADKTHTHTKSQITDFPSTLPNPTSFTIKVNSGTSEGSNLYTYNGTNAKTLDIKAGSNITLTPSSGSLTISSTNTTYNVATTSTNGLMSSSDKAKLDGIAANANNYVHPTTSGNKHIPSGGSSGQILRWASDGTATWGNDNNTTYSQASSTTLGLVKIGYKENGRNYPVELSNGQMYVNVPWTDTKYTLSSFGITATADELNYCDGVTSNIQTQLNKKIEEAPSDGRKYARMNGEWVRVEDNLAIIEIDQTISDPATKIGGNVNGFVIQWIRKNSHRVLAKKTGDGTVTYIELDDNNSNKYAADGTAAATDGSEGDVFVKLPTFYYKGTEGDNVKLYFSLSKIDDSYVEWNTNTLIGAYKAYHNGGKLYSRSGVKSSYNTSQEEYKSYAAARGSGYQLVDWQMHCVLGCLFYAMYGNTNSEAICGEGPRSTNNTCGATNSLGMTDTKAETNGNTMSINFWGLESWWGGYVSECMEGIESTSRNTVQILSPDPSSGRTFTWYAWYNNMHNYAIRYRFGKYLDLSNNTTGFGTSSIYYCDANSGPTTSSRVVWRADGGVSEAFADAEPSFGNNLTGSRLAFRGVCTKANSVQAFKSLPIR